MILMRHEVTIKWPDNRRELKGINMIEYGDPNGYTAMAKTVGYPCAIATKMVLDEEIQRTGMVLPFTQSKHKILAAQHSEAWEGKNICLQTLAFLVAK